MQSLDKLDDAGALALINAHIDRDARMSQLRKKWLGEFQKVLGGKLSPRASCRSIAGYRSRIRSYFPQSIPLVH